MKNLASIIVIEIRKSVFTGVNIMIPYPVVSGCLCKSQGLVGAVFKPFPHFFFFFLCFFFLFNFKT